MSIVKIRNKITEKEAVQWTGENLQTMNDFMPSKFVFGSPESEDELIIFTLEGDHYAKIGDWIIKGLSGEFYPCKPDIFEKSYEIIS